MKEAHGLDPLQPNPFSAIMHPKLSIILGILFAALSVGAGAFGTHALSERFDPDQLASWETAVTYQMWHAIALVAYGLFRVVKQGKGIAAWGFILGTLLFSGSIYCLCLEVLPEGLGIVTPIGGSVLLLGWVVWFFQAMK